MPFGRASGLTKRGAEPPHDNSGPKRPDSSSGRRGGFPPKRSWTSVEPFAFAHTGQDLEDAGGAAEATGRNPQGTAQDVLLALCGGNKRFVQGLQRSLEEQPSLRQLHMPRSQSAPEPDLRSAEVAEVRSVLVADARLPVPLEAIFDQAPGAVMAVQMCGPVCFPAAEGPDSIVGSIEYAIARHEVKLVVVLAYPQGDALGEALACAVERMDRQASSAYSSYKNLDGWRSEHLNLIARLVPVVARALSMLPDASFPEHCMCASTLNTWKTIEDIMKSSPTVATAVMNGEVELHGAYFDAQSGRVQFLGQHPIQDRILVEHPALATVRRSEAQAVPAEEALAALHAGNARYCSGQGGKMSSRNEELLMQLRETPPNPLAVVLGCADSRAPIEILFDACIGDLFVLWDTGHASLHESGNIVKSMEYCLNQLHTRLVVVTGHTKCRAVTAAVQAARRGEIDESFPALEAAVKAVQELPSSPLEDQVKLATKLNIFCTIGSLIALSPVIKTAVRSREVQVHGGVYDAQTGSVTWLGEHPDLERIAERPMMLQRWKTAPYVREPLPEVLWGGAAGSAATALMRLGEGNQRFVQGMPQPVSSDFAPEPFVAVLAASELLLPVELLFDSGPGELLVHRVCGSIIGRASSPLVASVEYAVVRFSMRLFVVLGDLHSADIEEALLHLSGAGPGAVPVAGQAHSAIDHVAVSVRRALEQANAEMGLSQAERDQRARHLAVELNCFYTIERLLQSPVLRDEVRFKGLELHAAIFDGRTGQVEFIGQHPMIHDIVVGTMPVRLWPTEDKILEGSGP